MAGYGLQICALRNCLHVVRVRSPAAFAVRKLALHCLMVMTLAPAEFIRRFMLHVLPKGFHRIRHYGLLASSRAKADTIARARELIAQAASPQPPRPAKQDEATAGTEATDKPIHPCPCCGGRMIIIETFEAGSTPRHRPTASAIAIRVDTS